MVFFDNIAIHNKTRKHLTGHFCKNDLIRVMDFVTGNQIVCKNEQAGEIVS
jgi:hypothetical protein